MKRASILLASFLAFFAITPLAPGQSETAPSAPATPQPSTGERPSSTPPQSSQSVPDAAIADQYEAERLQIWTSPEMQEARAWIIDRSKRSRRFGPDQAQRYLTRLRQLSPEGMRKWLQWFERRQASIARSESVARAARQQAVEHAVGRLEATQQSYDNFNQGQTAAAILSQQRYVDQQQLASDLAADRDIARTLQLQQMLTPDYSGIIPSRYMMWAASASLPGDLPRGDPLNSYRGDDRGGEPGPPIADNVDANSGGGGLAAPPPDAGGGGGAGAGGAAGGAGAGTP